MQTAIQIPYLQEKPYFVPTPAPSFTINSFVSPLTITVTVVVISIVVLSLLLYRRHRKTN